MRFLCLEEVQGIRSYVFKSFPNDKLPCYAILSHTWGEEGTEITYQDVVSDDAPAHDPYNGYHKLEFCKSRVEEDGLKYFWVGKCAFVIK